MSTAIHRRVEACRAGADPTCIARLAAGWAVMGDRQVLPGYCLLLPDPVVPHLNAMAAEAQAEFLADMARLGQAVLEVDGRRAHQLRAIRQPRARAARARVPALCVGTGDLRTAHPWSYDWTKALPFDPGRDGALLAALRERLLTGA